MFVLYPTVTFRRVTGITPRLLERMGIRALILDVDNTLTTHNNPIPDKDVLAWMEKMKLAGIKLVIVSNNHDARIRPFAGMLGVEYTANALKPLPLGFRVTARKLRLPPRQIAVVGDQVFTDILGGNLFGAATILVEPMEPETGPFFRLKRKVERRVLGAYRRAYPGRRKGG